MAESSMEVNGHITNEQQKIIDRGDIYEFQSLNFVSREAFLNIAKSFFTNKGYALSIKSSRKDKYVTVGCSRGGEYRDRLKNSTKKRERSTTTRLINCPFEIKAKRDYDSSWKVEIINDSHNHNASNDMSGYPSARALSKDEVSIVDEMSKSGAPPRQIISFLRGRNPSLLAASRDIYNTKAKIIKATLCNRSNIQVLFEELGNGGFTFDILRDDQDHLTHVFLAHPKSIQLTRSFFNVFSEVLEDYIWALNSFAQVLGLDCKPSVIVTDRELALMKAIEIVFPQAANILCVWHIEKNICVNCKTHFEENKDWVEFLSSWNNIVYSRTSEIFDTAWHEFEQIYGGKKNIVNYIQKTWLPHKMKFISAWTEKYLHFGNRASSRAEGAHSKLKKYLLVSTGDLRGVKDKMSQLIHNDVQEFKTKMASEKLHIPLNCNIHFFKDVITRVSLFAMKELHGQYQMAFNAENYLIQSECSKQFVATMGLPCSHVMKNLQDGVLPLQSIHPQWRIDSRSSIFDDGNGNEFGDLMTKLNNSYKQWPVGEKLLVHDQLCQIVDGSPLLFEPRIQRSKGRPKNLKSKSSTKRNPSQFEVVESQK